MKRFTAFFAPIFKNLWQTTPPDCCREQTGKIKKFSLRLPKRPLFTVVVVNSGQNTPPQSLYWWSKPVYPQTRAAEESGSFLEQDSTEVPKFAFCSFKTVRAKSEQIRAEYQNDLAGMVFCADCGRPMEFERLPHGAEESKKVCYYICKARQADDKCISHQIPEKLLKALIMDQLHLFIVQLSDKRKVLEELQKIEDVQNPVYRAKGEIMSLTDKVSQMAKKREQLYADYVAGVVDSEDYQLIREDYSRQYDGLRAALQEAENKKAEVERQIEEYLNMTSHLEEHLDNFEFDIQLVKSLVQKIEVSADKRIRIVFGFQDVFTELGKESAET